MNFDIGMLESNSHTAEVFLGKANHSLIKGKAGC
jgi:hypothetical protein